ncbi:MAG: NAD+ synthase [Planctomycetota bacterium]
MKIALCQINPKIGDFDGNCARIEASAQRAKAAGADIAVFSEMSVIGYPARDLLEKPAFIDAQERALGRLCVNLKTVIPVLVGCVRRRDSHIGRPLHNSWAFIRNGRIEECGDKCLLPTYDVFDEDRYFEPATAAKLVDFNGVKLGLTICEDCWNDKDFWVDRKYGFDPVDDLVRRGADVIVNLSASPFNIGKLAVKMSMLGSLAKKHARPLIYVNQVGGNDELVFDGRSMAFAANGSILAVGDAFGECERVVDLADLQATGIASCAATVRMPNAKDVMLSVEEEVHRALVLGTRDYAQKCGFKSAVLGLSGGIDSALVAVIAAEAFGPENVTGVAMPSRYNSEQSYIDAKDTAERLGIHFKVIPIEGIVSAFSTGLAPVFEGTKTGIAEENIQARIRGVLMMAMSNKFGHLLLTTGNKSELATGYCTLYGDMCGGLAVISDLYKTMVYRLSRHLNTINPARPPIPESSIVKAPTAELRENQKDQDSLPPYDMLDDILKAVIEDQRGCEELIAGGFDETIVRKVLRMIDINEYKRRQAAPGLKVTTKAFGTGRRIPIAQKI